MTFIFATLAILFAVKKPLPPGVARVAKRVEAHADWVADAARCPTEVMPRRVIELGPDHCKMPYDPCVATCETGDGRSCFWLANELQEAGAAPTTYKPLYQRACRLGIVSGCTNHAAGMLDGDGARDLKTLKCTARTFEKACDLDDPWACTMYATQLTRGAGVPQNDTLALKVLEKSCKYGPEDPACRSAGDLRKEIALKH